MAERKQASPVRTRDAAFTARIEAKREKHSGSFDIMPIEEPNLPVSPVKRVVNQEPVKHTAEKQVVGASTPRTKAKVPRKPAKSIDSPAGKKDQVNVPIYVGVPTDLHQRSERWAELAKCPPKRIALKALTDLRPKLIEMLPEIDLAAELDDTNTKISDRINTSLSVSAETMKLLESRFNPHGFNSIPSLVARWVRREFNEYYDEFLRDAGY